MNGRRGFASVVLALIVVLILGGGYVIYRILQGPESNNINIKPDMSSEERKRLESLQSIQCTDKEIAEINMDVDLKQTHKEILSKYASVIENYNSGIKRYETLLIESKNEFSTLKVSVQKNLKKYNTVTKEYLFNTVENISNNLATGAQKLAFTKAIIYELERNMPCWGLSEPVNQKLAGMTPSYVAPGGSVYNNGDLDNASYLLERVRNQIKSNLNE
ncbi:MAG: hypothetical protein Q7S86_00720 [bacterium]|nr:hypothetical protein [bacterium]